MKIIIDLGIVNKIFNMKQLSADQKSSVPPKYVDAIDFYKYHLNNSWKG